MIAVERRVAADLRRIVLVVRPAVEADAGAAIREQLALRERIDAAREIACAEQRRHARDVRLERERDQIEVQLDVLVELLRHSRWQVDLGHVARRLGGKLDAPLDFANLVGVLVDGLAIRRSELLPQAGELADERIENAAALLHARGALFGRRAAAEQAFEHDLRIELHRQRAGLHTASSGGVGSSTQEIEFVYEQLYPSPQLLELEFGSSTGELQRRQQRVLADFLRDELIDRRASDRRIRPAVLRGLMPVRYAAATQWSDPVVPSGGSADFDQSPLITTVWSFTVSSDSRMYGSCSGGRGASDAGRAPPHLVRERRLQARRRRAGRRARRAWCSSSSRSFRCSYRSTPPRTSAATSLHLLLRRAEPLHRFDADARRGRQHAADARRLGARRPVLVHAHRPLVGGEAQLRRRVKASSPPVPATSA